MDGPTEIYLHSDPYPKVGNRSAAIKWVFQAYFRQKDAKGFTKVHILFHVHDLFHLLEGH